MSSSGSVGSIDDFNEEEAVGEKISYTWVIENIDSCFKDEKNLLRSPPFYNKECDRGWKIILVFPPKSVLSGGGYLGVYLSAILLPNDGLDVEFTVFVRDSEDQVIMEGTKEIRFTKGVKSWGHPNMIRLSELRSKMRDKILQIHADVVIIKYEVLPISSCLSETTLHGNLKVLFESSSSTDVVFEVNEREFKAHKCILSARSPVFAAMFTDDNIEKHSGVIKIMDSNFCVFRRFLHFVYFGRVSIPSVDIALGLFLLADKYDFPGLKFLCVKHMSTNLTSFNVGDVLLLAEVSNIDDLKQTAMNYMVENIEIFCDVEMEAYKFLEKHNPKLLTEFFVMSSKNLLKKIPP